MSESIELQNHVKALRLARGWSQAELAERAGISRAAVSAIEIERLVPSVAAALALARALECRVDALFCLNGESPQPTWAWPAPTEPCRFWQAEVNGRHLLFPVEMGVAGVIPHDGVATGAKLELRNELRPEQTIVLATCDPAAPLLAAELARSTPYRLIVISHSSGAALDLLGKGLVHAAGIHLAKAGSKTGNAAAVQKRLGAGYSLLRVASWYEGIALGPQLADASVSSILRQKKLRWIGREAGSGARQCLDELLPPGERPRHEAKDHRGVAEAIRCGWADVGVCVQLTSEDAGLGFLGVREEAYDLCFQTAALDEPRVKGLIAAARSAAYRRLLGELPGYQTRGAGELEEITR